MIRRSVFYAGILFACSLLNAQTAQQRKADMDNVLPANMKVRMVWARGSKPNRTVYAYDSEENVIRELTPISLIPSGQRDFAAYISMDGQSVVLKDYTTQSIKVIDFDGNNLRNLTSRGTIVCTWQDPNDNTQYLIASGLPAPNSDGTWAIGIVDQTRKNQISPAVFPKVARDYMESNGSGLSVDGTRIGGYNGAGGNPGLWTLPSGNFVSAVSTCRGCNYAMRPTTATGVYEYGHFRENHRRVCVHNADGSRKQTLNMTCANPAIDPGNEAENLYWTNHVDYVTARLEDNSPGPVLFDLARGRCAALENNQSNLYMPNAVLLPKVPVEARMPSLATRIPQVSRTPQKLYSIEGRLISKSHVGSSKAAVRSLRIPHGNQEVGIVVGTGIQ